MAFLLQYIEEVCTVADKVYEIFFLKIAWLADEYTMCLYTDKDRKSLHFHRNKKI